MEMSVPNQTMREFGSPDGRWIADHRSCSMDQLMFPTVARSEEECLLQDLARANELVRLAGMRETRHEFMWPGELRAIYSYRRRALERLLEFHELALRRRQAAYLVSPISVLHGLEDLRVLDLMQSEPGRIIRIPDGSLPRSGEAVTYTSEGMNTADACPPPIRTTLRPFTPPIDHGGSPPLSRTRWPSVIDGAT